MQNVVLDQLVDKSHESIAERPRFSDYSEVGVHDIGFEHNDPIAKGIKLLNESTTYHLDSI